MIATMTAVFLTTTSLAATTLPSAELALKGLDPVMLCEGKEIPGRADLEESRGPYTYRFSETKNRARFLDDPERWGIQWGGRCARMGPLSGAGSPNRWTVHRGRIYLFASDGCREGFLSKPEIFIVETQEPTSVTEASRIAGLEWIGRAVGAHGGVAAIDAVHGLRLVAENSDSDWSHRLEQVITKDGGLMRCSTWTPPTPEQSVHDTKWVLSNDTAFLDEGDTAFELTSPAQLEDLRRFCLREPLAFLWARNKSEFVAEYRGPGELNDQSVENVGVHWRGLTTTLHLEPESGKILGLSWRGRAGEGVTRTFTEQFTEWEQARGVLVPLQRRTLTGNKEIPGSFTAWQAVELLDRVPETTFRGIQSLETGE